jgi:hypothetical protein
MRRPSRQAHRRYLILCTGHTEEIYAKEIKERLPRQAQRGIAIEIVRPGSGTDARSLMTEARRKREIAKSEGVPYSRIWILCDHDDDPHIPRLFQMAEREGISLAYSRPCLEFWYLLHFQRSGRSFFRCDEVIGQLRGHWPAYQKTEQRHFSILGDRLEDAVRHAMALRAAAEPDLAPWEQNPWTTMDEFVAWFLALGEPVGL